jgi:hypothetical protein
VIDAVAVIPAALTNPPLGLMKNSILVLLGRMPAPIGVPKPPM